MDGCRSVHLQHEGRHFDHCFDLSVHDSYVYQWFHFFHFMFTNFLGGLELLWSVFNWSAILYTIISALRFIGAAVVLFRADSAIQVHCLSHTACRHKKRQNVSVTTSQTFCQNPDVFVQQHSLYPIGFVLLCFGESSHITFPAWFGLYWPWKLSVSGLNEASRAGVSNSEELGAAAGTVVSLDTKVFN